MAFVAGLWSGRLICWFRPLSRCAACTAAPIALAGCSEIALSNNAMPPGGEPGYVSLSAKYLQSVLKDVHTYDGFEISGLRWVTTIKGWSWLACVRFHDHGHTRIYAIFIQDGAVSDARYAVETDSLRGADLYAIRSGIGRARTAHRSGAATALLSAYRFAIT
jgi:hypothetical protein